MKEDWFLTLVRDMIKNKFTLVDLKKLTVAREKDSLTRFNFSVSISKSVFEDILSEEEKALLWLEGGKDE